MKRFDSLKTWMVPTLLFSMMTFMSCGHRQSRQSDDLFSGMDSGQGHEESVADNTAAPAAEKVAEVEAKSPELMQADAAPEAAKEDIKAEVAKDLAEGSEAKMDVKMDAPVVADNKANELAIPSDSEASKKIDLVTSEDASKDVEAKADETPSVSSEDALSSASTEMKGDEMIVADAKQEMTAPAPELMPSNTTNAPTAQLSDADSISIPSVSELANDAKSAASEATPEASTSTKTEAKATVKPAAEHKTVVAPQIPKEVVWQGSQTMNRYYFLRNGDNTESVSQLIYGNSQHSADLKKWNSGRWTTGRMILFVSNSRPEDGDMKSFYEEKGISPDSYTVQSGDWLSKISMNTYGDAGSWKEIAAVNGISSPDSISKGQSLKLYPTKLGQAAEKVAMLEAPASPTAVAPAPAPTVAANTQADQFDRKPLAMDEEGFVAPPPLPGDKVVAPHHKAKASSKLASPEIGGFIAQNITWIVGGAVAAMIFFLFSRKFRKPSDHMEE